MDPAQLIPGGIQPTDHWHVGTNDGTCSRCRQPVPDTQVPLMVWAGEDGDDMLIYCPACLGWSQGVDYGEEI